jgi:hypothetical protein
LHVLFPPIPTWALFSWYSTKCKICSAHMPIIADLGYLEEGANVLRIIVDQT